jgi:hypothetical protein
MTYYDTIGKIRYEMEKSHAGLEYRVRFEYAPTGRLGKRWVLVMRVGVKTSAGVKLSVRNDVGRFDAMREQDVQSVIEILNEGLKAQGKYYAEETEAEAGTSPGGDEGAGPVTVGTETGQGTGEREPSEVDAVQSQMPHPHPN